MEMEKKPTRQARVINFANRIVNPSSKSFQMQTPDEKTRKTASFCLPTFSCPMAPAALRTAIARLRQFAIGTDAGLGVQAPEQAVVAGGHRRIGLGQNELAFPAQRRTQVRMIGVEAFRFLESCGTSRGGFQNGAGYSHPRKLHFVGIVAERAGFAQGSVGSFFGGIFIDWLARLWPAPLPEKAKAQAQRNREQCSPIARSSPAF